MNNITKVSEITVEDIAEYLRLDEYLEFISNSNDDSGTDPSPTPDPSDPSDDPTPPPSYISDIENTLSNLLNISKAFISNYTGHTIEELDNYTDFIIIVFILCQDMWDNRTLYVDKGTLSYPVETILGLHSINLLPND